MTTGETPQRCAQRIVEVMRRMTPVELQALDRAVSDLDVARHSATILRFWMAVAQTTAAVMQERGVPERFDRETYDSEETL